MRIVHDCWSGHVFLRENESEYTEEKNNHGAGILEVNFRVHLI